MARRKNPLFDPVSREIEAAVGGSMVVVDQWFDEMDKLRQEHALAQDLAQDLVARIQRHKKDGWTKDALEPDVESLKEVRKRVNHLKREMKIIDRRIASYYKAALKDISERLDVIKALPGSGMYAREYRDARRMLVLAKKQAQYAHVDVRPKISQLRGAVKTLEDATSSIRPTGMGVALSGARGRLRPKKAKAERKSAGDAFVEIISRWKVFKPKAKATKEYKSGVTKISRIERGGGDPDNYRDRDIDFAKHVKDVDLMAQILKRRIQRGEPGQEKNLRNLKEQIDLLASKMGEEIRQKAESPEAVISKIGRLRRSLIAMRKKTRRSPRDIDKAKDRLETLKALTGVKMTKGWSQQDRRNALSGIRDVEALIASMEGIKLSSGVAKRLGISQSKKHRISSKAIAKRSGNPKKKKAKKKASKKSVKKLSKKHESALKGGAVGTAVGGTAGALAGGPVGAAMGAGAGGYIGAKTASSRNPTPEWERLVRRCQKLWDHYCERPGKKRLQDVLKHLEKMKASKSKKVLDERKRCLRVANKEAKRLRLKK